jgi:outer membrane protein TolC
MKNLVWCLLLWTMKTSAQDSTLFTLEQCQQQARQNYPLLKQQEVFTHILQLQNKNSNSAYLPQAELNGQATYQSDVTQIPIKIPNINIPVLSKDQYRATVDIKQLLYDGGFTRQQKELQSLQQLTSQQQVEVELFRLKQQVTQLYFSALLAKEYIATAQEAAADVKQRIERLTAGVKYGSVLPSNVDLLQAELLKLHQQEIAARSSQRSALDVLQLLTGNQAMSRGKLTMPAPIAERREDTLNRPELQLYSLQSKVLHQQAQLTGTKQLPRVSAFVQGGYGRPGLNMLNNDFAGFYMGGLRLSWTLWNWKYQRNEQQVLALQQQNVASQSATFTLNTRVQLAQQEAEIDQLKQVLETDQDIITLRTRVKEASAAQLDNGVITVHDYLSDLNAESQAQISKRTHEIQLALAYINYQLIQGY